MKDTRAAVKPRESSRRRNEPEPVSKSRKAELVKKSAKEAAIATTRSSRQAKPAPAQGSRAAAVASRSRADSRQKASTQRGKLAIKVNLSGKSSRAKRSVKKSVSPVKAVSRSRRQEELDDEEMSEYSDEYGVEEYDDELPLDSEEDSFLEEERGRAPPAKRNAAKKEKRAPSPKKKVASPVKAKDERVQRPVIDHLSVTESEPDSMIVVDMPGTQHVPHRRNKGSLDLFSDEEENAKLIGKHSDANSEGDNSAEDDLKKWIQERNDKKPPQNESPSRSSRRQSGSRRSRHIEEPSLEEESEDNEMTYQCPPAGINHTQPCAEPSDYEESDAELENDDQEYDPAEVFAEENPEAQNAEAIRAQEEAEAQ